MSIGELTLGALACNLRSALGLKVDLLIAERIGYFANESVARQAVGQQMISFRIC
jgi:hypothetical protein